MLIFLIYKLNLKSNFLKNKELNNKSEHEIVNSMLDLETKNNDSILDKIISNSENNNEILGQKINKESNNFDLNTDSNSLDNNDLNELDIIEQQIG
jgi:hypothetical protein